MYKYFIEITNEESEVKIRQSIDAIDSYHSRPDGVTIISFKNGDFLSVLESLDEIEKLLSRCGVFTIATEAARGDE